MDEVDTKPFESVEAAVTLFEQKAEPKKNKSARNEEIEKEMELDQLQKELAAYKLQLEIKESSHMQALLELDICSKKIGELSNQLHESEAAKEKYMKECMNAQIDLDTLDSENTTLLGRLLQSDVSSEIFRQNLHCSKINQEELNVQFAASHESKLAALRQIELMEAAMKMEQEKTEKVLNHVSELNEAILFLKLSAIEAEKQKTATILLKDEELNQAHEQLEVTLKQLEAVEGLENQLHYKILFTESLELELKQAKESAFDALKESECLKIELEQVRRGNAETEIYIKSLEMDLNLSRAEVQSARQASDNLNCQIDSLMDEMQKGKTVMAQFEERDSAAQLEIANLNSELHRVRSKLAAAEAAEARAESVKSGLYLAVQELATEAEEAKKEIQRWKKAAEESEKNVSSESGSSITISREEYERLIGTDKNGGEGQSSQPMEDPMVKLEDGLELEELKRVLEAAQEELANVKLVAEKAGRQAEQAEKAKVALEHQLRKYREQKEKRRAAIAALKEESSRWISESLLHERTQGAYQPLGKVLNMKF